MSVSIRAVLFDWAGTMIDHGSRAPVEVVREVFHRRGVEVTEAEARGPMGMAKFAHLAAVLDLPRVRAAWQEAHGRSPAASDIEALYRDFLPLQEQILASHARLIPGAAETAAWLRQRGIRIGSSTGYTRQLMAIVLPLAASQGYSPDVCICPDEVPAGRPAPDLNLRAMERLGLDDPAACLVVDDTVVGIQAGIAAGMPTVAVARTGNALGLSEEVVAAMERIELQDRLAAIHQMFRDAGATHVIESVAELRSLPVWTRE
jgi:phosphonoacetaldehyde hydrolase